MPKYRLLISFEVKPLDSSPFPESFDEIREFKDIKAAEKELESITSTMVSGYSDQGYLWTILEKCVVLHKEQKESDLSMLLL
jgi:hypothetical protein